MYVITFYSFKGGVGRTMALVNIAAELVRRGRKVLVVDFDLEAPGLETYKHLQPPKTHQGIVEYVTEFRRTNQVPNLVDYLYEAKPIGKKGGRLWVMPAGRRDSAYRTALVSLDWKRLYKDEDGFLLFEDTKKGWEEELKPDYVLIDSRTGDTDVKGICTRQLPDSVVIMFTPNEQNLAGLENVCRDIRREKSEGLKKAIRLHFVATNVPDLDDEKRILHRQLQAFRERLEFDQFSGTILRYENLDLLDQSVFTIDRPRSKLARSYRRLLRTLVLDNPADRDGALLFLKRYAERFLPEVVRDSRPRVVQKLTVAKDSEERLGSVSFQLSSFIRFVSITSERWADKIKEITVKFLNDPEILLRVAECRIEESEFERAEKLLDWVLKIKPDMGEALLTRALCKNRRGDKEGAVNDLLQYFRVPGDDQERVLRAFRELHAIAPNRIVEAADLPAIRGLVGSELFEVCQRLIETKEGRSRASELDPTNCDYLILARRWNEAIKLLEANGLGDLDQDGLFAWTMAHWGKTGELSQQACQLLLDRREEDDCTILAIDISAQSRVLEGFLLWGAAKTEEALKKVDEAITIVQEDPRIANDWGDRWSSFSPWCYRHVSSSQFLEDCQLLRRMIQGEPLRPAFLGPAK